MKYKAYLRFLFSSIILQFLSLDGSCKAEYEHNLPPSAQATCKNFDKKIAEQEQLLQITISKIQTLEATATFLARMSTAHETLQEQPLYKKAKALKESLYLVQELKNYNANLIHPTLIQKIDRSLRLPVLQEHDVLLSFLRKERIHLLEMNDEYIVIQTFCRHIKSIEQDLTQELASLIELLCKTAEISQLHTLHQEYIKNENIQTLKRTCNRIWDLHLDKEIKILKQTGYREILRTNMQNNLKNPLQYSCFNGLKDILELEQRYYLESLDVREFTNMCIRLPFE